MLKPVYVERQLLDRMRAAGEATLLLEIFKEIQGLKLERYHEQLRSEAVRLAGLAGVKETHTFTDTVGHIEQQRAQVHRRKRRLAREIIDETIYCDEGAVRALLHVGPRRHRVKKFASENGGNNAGDEGWSKST